MEGMVNQSATGGVEIGMNAKSCRHYCFLSQPVQGVCA
jgi:hypothetical protein